MRAPKWLRVMYGAIVVIALLYSIAPPWGEQADIWETAASINSISHSPFSPSNPLLDFPGDTSPRFTPFTVWWGIVERVLGLPLFTTVAIAGLLNVLLFFTGLARVIRTLSLDPRAILWIVPVMLIGWGHGYGEANGYQAELFFATLPYVGMFTYGICFHGLAELDRFLTQGSRSGLIAYTLLGIIAFLTHPITALLLFVAAFAWAIVRAPIKTALLIQGIALIALGSCWLWPYFDYPTLLFRGTSENWYQVRLFDDQISKLGPVLLGLLVAGYFALKKKHLEPVIALGCSLAIYVASWMLDIQIGSRFIFYGAIFAHICIGLYLFESGLFREGFWKRPIVQSGLALVLAIAVFVPGVYYRVRKLDTQWKPAIEYYSQNHRLLEPWQDMEFMRGKLNENSVVMAEDTVGWRLPAITEAKLVAQAKGDPLIQEEVNSRRMDVVHFFDSVMSTDDRRQLLTKYHCTNVLVDERHANRNSWTLRRDLDSIADLIATRSPYRLYRVKSSY